MAYFVKLTKTGNKINPTIPNNKIANTVIKYPNKEGLYSTIELLTASQKGHLTFVDLKFRLINLLFFIYTNFVSLTFSKLKNISDR